MSGKRASRPGLDPLLADRVAVVMELDRLGRSMIHTARSPRGDSTKGEIGFKSLKDSVDTSTASGRMLFNLLASFAEYERELIVERTLTRRGARAGQRPGGRSQTGDAAATGTPGQGACGQQPQARGDRQAAQSEPCGGVPVVFANSSHLRRFRPVIRSCRG